jgi:hypothetical protein
MNFSPEYPSSWSFNSAGARANRTTTQPRSFTVVCPADRRILNTTAEYSNVVTNMGMRKSCLPCPATRSWGNSICIAISSLTNFEWTFFFGQTVPVKCYALSTTISVLFWLSVRTKQKPEFAIIRLMFHSSLMNVDEPHSPSDLEFLRSARKTRFLN